MEESESLFLIKEQQLVVLILKSAFWLLFVSESQTNAKYLRLKLQFLFRANTNHAVMTGTESVKEDWRVEDIGMFESCTKGRALRGGNLSAFILNLTASSANETKRRL